MKKIQKFSNFLKEEFGEITSREYPEFDYVETEKTFTAGELLDAIKDTKVLDGKPRYNSVEFDTFIEHILHKLGIRDMWAMLDEDKKDK